MQFPIVCYLLLETSRRVDICWKSSGHCMQRSPISYSWCTHIVPCRCMHRSRHISSSTSSFVFKGNGRQWLNENARKSISRPILIRNDTMEQPYCSEVRRRRILKTYIQCRNSPWEICPFYAKQFSHAFTACKTLADWDKWWTRVKRFSSSMASDFFFSVLFAISEIRKAEIR